MCGVYMHQNHMNFLLLSGSSILEERRKHLLPQSQSFPTKAERLLHEQLQYDNNVNGLRRRRLRRFGFSSCLCHRLLGTSGKSLVSQFNKVLKHTPTFRDAIKSHYRLLSFFELLHYLGLRWPVGFCSSSLVASKARLGGKEVVGVFQTQPSPDI